MFKNSTSNKSASVLAFAALVASLGFVAVPASANSDVNSKEYRCSILPAQARAAADNADASKQRVAQRQVATGLKLCEAGNSRAAAQQFRAALKTAGVVEAAAE